MARGENARFFAEMHFSTAGILTHGNEASIYCYYHSLFIYFQPYYHYLSFIIYLLFYC